MELINLLIYYYVQLTLIIVSTAPIAYDTDRNIKELTENDFENIIDHNEHQGTKTDFSDNYMTLGTAPQITQNLKDFTTKSYMLMYDKHGMLAKTSQHQQLSKFDLNLVTMQDCPVGKHLLPNIS